MKDTALSEAINKMKLQLGNDKMYAYHAGLRIAIQLATELLPKEKEIIIEAYNTAIGNEHSKSKEVFTGTRYFNSTFKNHTDTNGE